MKDFSFPIGNQQIIYNGSAFLSGVLGNDDSVISSDGQAESNSSTQENPNSASGDDTGETGGLFGGLLPILVIYGLLFFAIYFFLFRPQRKRDKQIKEMQGSLKVGDNVVTSGGFFGKIVELGTDAHVVEFGSNRGIRVPVRVNDILGVKNPVLTPPHNKEIAAPASPKE